MSLTPDDQGASAGEGLLYCGDSRGSDPAGLQVPGSAGAEDDLGETATEQRRRRSIARIQAEEQRLKDEMESIKREKNAAANALEMEVLLGDSQWVRDLGGGGSVGSSAAASPEVGLGTLGVDAVPPLHGGSPGDGFGDMSARKSTGGELKVANLLDGEHLDAADAGGGGGGGAARPSEQSVGAFAGMTSPTNSVRGKPQAPKKPPVQRVYPQLPNDKVAELKKTAFRSVGRDSSEDLEEALGDVDPNVWLHWANGAGDSLLKMADARKREKALHTLRKLMGVSDMNDDEKRLQPGDNVWVFRDLGEAPEQATVKEVHGYAEDSDDDDDASGDDGDEPKERKTGGGKEALIAVQYWDSRNQDQVVPAARCRLMLSNDTYAS